MDIVQEVTRVRALSGNAWQAGKVGLLLVAVVIVAFSVVRGDRPAEAATGTAIVVSSSTTSPTPIPYIFIYPNSQTSQTVYVWADNVKDTAGVAAFEIYFTYDTDLVTLSQLSVVDTNGTPIFPGQEDQTWLATTGRQVICLPPVWDSIPPYTRQTPDTSDDDSIWEAQIGCHTDGDPPPFGPLGDGLLATITLDPVVLPPPQNTPLSIAIPHANPQFTYKTWLVNTTVGEFPTEIPASVPVPDIRLVKCANFDGSGGVDVPGDILQVILRWGMDDTDPEWDPKYDLDNSGQIDVAIDILGAIFQYQTSCLQA